MKQFFYLLAASSILLTSCNKPFKKAKGGLQYKIISEGKGKTIANGTFFEIQFDQVYKGPGKDTILFDSRTSSNNIVPMDSVQIPPVYYKIFSESRKGDSIITKQLTDSIMKGNTPPFMKKGAYIISHYKIVNVFETKEAAEAAYKVQMETARVKDSIKAIGQSKADDKLITDYLAKNNIKAVKAPEGTYVEIITPGAGPNADTSVSAQVLYTGKTLKGVTFDSNMDTTGGRPSQPLLVSMNNDPSRGLTVIKGWTDGLTLLNKGAKARFYVPSTLAYGSQVKSQEIGANEILVFDINLVNLLNRNEAVSENEKMQKMMMEEQRNAMLRAQAQQQQGKGQ